MANILNAKAFPGTLCTSVTDGASPTGGWQQLARLLAADAPNAPNGSRNGTVVITGKIADVANIEVTLGGRACCEVSVRTSNGAYLPGYLFRVTQSQQVAYAAAHDHGVPFVFIVRQAAWPTGEALDLIGRVALYGDTLLPALPPNKLPQFQVRDISFAVFDETALGAHRVLYDSDQPATPQVLNSFNGAAYGTPSRLRMTANPFPFRWYLNGGALAGVSAGQTLGNAASSPTKTATVKTTFSLGSAFIEIDAVLTGSWTTGDSVYHGATLLGTLALAEEKWVVFTSVKFRPRSTQDSCALWHTLYTTGDWFGPSEQAWGTDMQGAQCHGPKDPIPSGPFAGLFSNEYQFGACSVVTIKNGTTTLGLRGINLYSPNGARWIFGGNLLINVGANEELWNNPSSTLKTATAVSRRAGTTSQNFLDIDITSGAWPATSLVYRASDGQLVGQIQSTTTDGQTASQYQRCDVFAVKAYTLPFWVLSDTNPGRLNFYAREGESETPQAHDLTVDENRQAVFFASGFPSLVIGRSGQSVATFVRFNDGSDYPNGVGRDCYVASFTNPSGYREGIPDLKIGLVDCVEGLNNFLVRGRNNPDEAQTAKANCLFQAFAVLPCQDTVNIYAHSTAPITGPTVYIGLGKEAVSLQGLPELTHVPDAMTPEELDNPVPSLRTLLGYELGRPTFSRARAKLRLSWSGYTRAEMDELEAELLSFTSGVFRYLDRQRGNSDPGQVDTWTPLGIDGATFSTQQNPDTLLWSASVSVYELRYYGLP